MTRNGLIAFATGVLFAVGLALAGMTQPSKVVGFLDFFGDWDPSLAFVMGGAILVYSPVYRLVTKRTAPLFASKWELPKRMGIDRRLLVGATLFGIGWGLGGFCPGPAIASVGSLGAAPLIFTAAMFAGFLLHRIVDVDRRAG